MCNQLEIRTVNNIEFQFGTEQGTKNRPISHDLHCENTWTAVVMGRTMFEVQFSIVRSQE